VTAGAAMAAEMAWAAGWPAHGDRDKTTGLRTVTAT